MTTLKERFETAWSKADWMMKKEHPGVSVMRFVRQELLALAEEVNNLRRTANEMENLGLSLASDLIRSKIDELV